MSTPLPTDPDLPSAPGQGGAAALVFVGGVVGGLARYGLDALLPHPVPDFPWTILAVNVAGAFLLGVVVVVATVRGRPELRLLVGTGVLGAFTTFSAYVVAAAQLTSVGEVAAAVGYAVGSVSLGVPAAFLGIALAERVVGPRP